MELELPPGCDWEPSLLHRKDSVFVFFVTFANTYHEQIPHSTLKNGLELHGMKKNSYRERKTINYIKLHVMAEKKKILKRIHFDERKVAWKQNTRKIPSFLLRTPKENSRMKKMKYETIKRSIFLCIRHREKKPNRLAAAITMYRKKNSSTKKEDDSFTKEPRIWRNEDKGQRRELLKKAATNSEI